MRHHDMLLSRGRLLKMAGLTAGALTYTRGAAASASLEDEESTHRSQAYNGSTDPFPIPWLDKNGSHNQPAGPNTELSHVYHFKGNVARCSGFVGTGTANNGERLAFRLAYDGLRLDDGRILGRAQAPARIVHSYLTDDFSGTGGSR